MFDVRIVVVLGMLLIFNEVINVISNVKMKNIIKFCEWIVMLLVFVYNKLVIILDCIFV